jgi:hypothetical protein
MGQSENVQHQLRSNNKEYKYWVLRSLTLKTHNEIGLDS